MTSPLDRPLTNTTVGVDLGQAQDYTAIVIVEWAASAVGPHEDWWRAPGATSPLGEPPPMGGAWVRKPIAEKERQYNVVHLERVPLRTPYPEIVQITAGIMDSIDLRGGGQKYLAVDATGVGRPVVDLMKAALLNPQPVTITGGTDATYNPYDGYKVPKGELMTTLQVIMQRKQLKIAHSLREGATLRKELENIRVKLSDLGHASYGTWREGENDDLVLALAIACWSILHASSQGIYC